LVRLVLLGPCHTPAVPLPMPSIPAPPRVSVALPRAPLWPPAPPPLPPHPCVCPVVSSTLSVGQAPRPHTHTGLCLTALPAPTPTALGPGAHCPLAASPSDLGFSALPCRPVALPLPVLRPLAPTRLARSTARSFTGPSLPPLPWLCRHALSPPRSPRGAWLLQQPCARRRRRPSGGAPRPRPPRQVALCTRVLRVLPSSGGRGGLR